MLNNEIDNILKKILSENKRLNNLETDDQIVEYLNDKNNFKEKLKDLTKEYPIDTEQPVNFLRAFIISMIGKKKISRELIEDIKNNIKAGTKERDLKSYNLSDEILNMIRQLREKEESDKEKNAKNNKRYVGPYQSYSTYFSIFAPLIINIPKEDIDNFIKEELFNGIIGNLKLEKDDYEEKMFSFYRGRGHNFPKNEFYFGIYPSSKDYHKSYHLSFLIEKGKIKAIYGCGDKINKEKEIETDYVNNFDEMINFFKKYKEAFLNSNGSDVKGEDMTNTEQNIPLNQILYGVPGTGKTYNTIVEALKIIAQKDEEIKKLIDEYKDESDLEKQHKIYQEELIQKFNELKRKGQIKFITFHQNYSYEDFVQGYKPIVKNNNMIYELKKGPLYEIHDNALFDKIEKKNTFDFSKMKSEFISKFPINSEFSTITGEKFEIVDYTEDSIRLQPKKGKTIYTFPYELLYKLLQKDKEHEIKERKDLEKILIDLNTYKGHSTYFFPILKEFAKIQPQNKNNEEKDNNLKEILIRQYYEGNATLKEASKNYVLIIDEINRGNISKIFGELITLIEEDKRIGNKHALTVPLMYKDPEKENNEFGIPNNLYIIGTMNTTDKSIALVDIALRRRFTFIEMKPNADLIKKDKLKGFLNEINNKLKTDLSKDHQIGHSYFIGKTENDLPFLWEHNIRPLLEEYFYGDDKKINNEYESIYKTYGREENNKSN